MTHQPATQGPLRLGVVAVILFVLGRWTLGVVFILLSGLAWTLTQFGSRRSARDDDKP